MAIKFTVNGQAVPLYQVLFDKVFVHEECYLCGSIRVETHTADSGSRVAKCLHCGTEFDYEPNFSGNVPAPLDLRPGMIMKTTDGKTVELLTEEHGSWRCDDGWVRLPHKFALPSKVEQQTHAAKVTRQDAEIQAFQQFLKEPRGGSES